MLNVSRVPFAAPGVYRAPETPLRTLTGVRMDVCGFAGVAPRGPVRMPQIDEHWPDTIPCVEADRPLSRSIAVAVESFDEYRRLYGGFEGPGLLPYAVASFFEQGGRRAWISRIVHRYDNADDASGVASGTLLGVTPTATLRARNEGDWGNSLRATLSLRAIPTDFDTATSDRLTLLTDKEIFAGCLLRLTLSDDSRVFRFVELLERSVDPDAPREVFIALLDTAVAASIESIEIVDATLEIDDQNGRREQFEQIGLHHAHPRWLAQVLCWQSQLVWPDVSWANDWLEPDSIDLVVPQLPSPTSIDYIPQFANGENRYADIVPSDVIDTAFLPEDEPGEGVNCFVQVDELATLCIPDLYSPEPLQPIDTIIDPVSLAGSSFERCVDNEPPLTEQEVADDDLSGLRLDPTAGDLPAIIELQQSVVNWAEQIGNFIVLLDVPSGLNQRSILQWRSKFDSAYAAAYHPWLTVTRREDSTDRGWRDNLVRLPPSAIAAGIIARTEIAFGIQHGPANAFAYEVVNVDDQISPRRHDELHPQGINVYLKERDGIRLTAARTLSRDPQWRQLSVRRLMIMLRRTLQREMQWAVFEPNGPRLWLSMKQLLQSFLQRLFRAGAFKGANESEAYFVHCDDTLNTRAVIEQGKVLVEIGVAPAEPIEFIVLRLSRDGDGTLTIEE